VILTSYEMSNRGKSARVSKIFKVWFTDVIIWQTRLISDKMPLRVSEWVCKIELECFSWFIQLCESGRCLILHVPEDPNFYQHHLITPSSTDFISFPSNYGVFARIVRTAGCNLTKTGVRNSDQHRLFWSMMDGLLSH